MENENVISLEQYIKNVEEEFANELKLITDKLVMQSSYGRGLLLFGLINRTQNNKIKYHLFNEWWNGCDDGQEYFTAKAVREWLQDAGITLDYSNLTFDKDGFVTVYRGENENSLGWDKGGISWTIDKAVAEKFARGVRLRNQDAKTPKVIVAKVNRENILAIIFKRSESELICDKVKFFAELNL